MQANKDKLDNKEVVIGRQQREDLPHPPPPPTYIKPNKPLAPPLRTGNGSINMADAHAKRQKEIRELMKKRREKAVLVDRISRWLFPTSFVLLNIVYWALFGDHELW